MLQGLEFSDAGERLAHQATREGKTVLSSNRGLSWCSHLKSKSIVSKYFLQKSMISVQIIKIRRGVLKLIALSRSSCFSLHSVPHPFYPCVYGVGFPSGCARTSLQYQINCKTARKRGSLVSQHPLEICQLTKSFSKFFVS
jgi:hypothetical protein